MWTPKTELLTNAKVLNIRVRQLSEMDAIITMQNVSRKFASSSMRGRLFEKLIECIGIKNEQAWQWIGEYRVRGPIFVFFEDTEGSDVFELESTKDFVRVYENCALFTIYLTDLENNFLIVYTNEQTLIAAGTAADWLECKTDGPS